MQGGHDSENPLSTSVGTTNMKHPALWNSRWWWDPVAGAIVSLVSSGTKGAFTPAAMRRTSVLRIGHMAKALQSLGTHT